MSFLIKTRGTRPQGSAIAEYHCEEHGRFELEVEHDENGDLPDLMPCIECGEQSIWCVSAPSTRVRKVEAVKGKWQKPERKTWTDTRNLGEGQPLYEWKEDRAKVWEEWRKRDVMRFAKEHHERPIGGD